MGSVWFVDCEWGFRCGRINIESYFEPVVFCAVNIHGVSHSFWGRDDRLKSFISGHINDQFVTHYAIAEQQYLIRMNIPLPERWFCTFTGWRWLTNGPCYSESSLVSILIQLGLPHLAPIAKY